MTAFSERLIKLRKQKGLSQEQLGAAVGVTRQTVSKWELGDTTPELGKLVQLSDYFQLSIDELVGHAAENDGDRTVELNGAPAVWHYEYKSKSCLLYTSQHRRTRQSKIRRQSRFPTPQSPKAPLPW